MSQTFCTENDSLFVILLSVFDTLYKVVLLVNHTTFSTYSRFSTVLSKNNMQGVHAISFQRKTYENQIQERRNYRKNIQINVITVRLL